MVVNGAQHALVCKGAQDAYMENTTPKEPFFTDRPFWNVPEEMLAGVRYQMVYGQLETVMHPTARPRDPLKLSLKLGRCADMINMVDLVVVNPNGLGINDYLQSVEVEIGGQRMCKMCVEDMETHIATNCALFGRRTSHINGKTFVPLTMAPLHQQNLVRLDKAMYHDVVINVHLKVQLSVELYARKYYLDSQSAHRLHEVPHSYITVQNQYVGSCKLRKGTNTIQLHFNHPMYLIYFWGFDKSRVRNITVRFDKKHDFYNGPLEPLEHFKLSQQGMADVEPAVVYFAHTGYFKPTTCSVNFSRMDHAELIIETDEEEERDVYVVGHNMQPLRCMGGMYGMVFSK